LFALVLVVQSLPFLASVALATLDSSRANEFAFWRTLEARLLARLPNRSAASATISTIAETPTPADKRIEAAQ
jgi:hypothetical protein